jgi:hypothetical protein
LQNSSQTFPVKKLAWPKGGTSSSRLLCTGSCIVAVFLLHRITAIRVSKDSLQLEFQETQTSPSGSSNL